MTRKPETLPRTLTACLFLLLAGVTLFFHVDMPWKDEWWLVPLIGKSYSGTLTLADLWQPHEAHRRFFPHVVYVGLARLTHWNLHWQVVFSLLCGLITFAGLCRLLRRIKPLIGDERTSWTAFLVALFVFSFRPWVNWILSLAKPMSTAATVWGVYFLSRAKFRKRDFAAACVMGVFAAYSIEAGFVFWILGIGLLLFSPYLANQRKKVYVPLWCLLFSAVTFIYLHGYPRERMTLGAGHDLPGALLFFLEYLGAYFSVDFAWLPGVLGIFLFLIFHLYLWKQEPFHGIGLLPFTALGLYSVGCGLLITAARYPDFAFEAVTSRYTTFSQFLWIANVVLAAVLLRRRNPKLNRVLFIVMAAALLTVSALTAALRFIPYTRIQNRVRTELLGAQRSEFLAPLHPDLAKVRLLLPVLKSHHLSLFRNAQ